METRVLSEKQLRRYASLKTPKEKRSVLAEYLNLFNIDEDDDLRSACLVDFIHENVDFAVSSGFTWKECIAFNTLMQDLLKETAGLPSLVAATSHTKDKLYHQMSSFSSRTIKLITVYIFSSYLTHFRLYQFVFTCARDTDQMTRHLTVDCPTDFMSMRNGKEESAWLKEQELQSIDKKREQRLKTMEVKREQELQGIEILRHKLLNEVDVGVSDIPDVTQLATQAVQDQLNATSRVLYGEIEDHGSRMNVHMETLALKSPVFAPALESTLSVPLIGKAPSGGTVSMPTKGKASPKPAQSKKNEKKKKGKN